MHRTRQLYSSDRGFHRIVDLLSPVRSHSRSPLARPPPSSCWQIVNGKRAASTVIVQPSTRPSRLRRYLFYSTIGLGAFAATFLYGLDNAFPLVGPFVGPLPSDEETLKLYKPSNEDARRIDEFIQSHPYVTALRRDPLFSESRPHLKLPKVVQEHHFTGGTLLGPGRVETPPISFNDTTNHKLVQVFHVGENLSGWPGVVHGGMLATLLDEGLARAAFPALPNRIAVTAQLKIDYKKPAMAGSYLVLKATTAKVEGRKAWVHGHIETLASNGAEPEILCTASALFIEPKNAQLLRRLHKEIV